MGGTSIYSFLGGAARDSTKLRSSAVPSSGIQLGNKISYHKMTKSHVGLRFARASGHGRNSSSIVHRRGGNSTSHSTKKPVSRSTRGVKRPHKGPVLLARKRIKFDSSNQSLSAIGSSVVRIFRHKKQKLYKPLGRWRFIRQAEGTLVSGHGSQGVITAYSMFDVAQCLTSSTENDDGNLWATNLFALNPYQTATSATFGAVTAPQQDMVHCHGVFEELMMTNFESCPCQISLYWVLNKGTTLHDASDAWTDACTQEALGQSSSTQATFNGTTTVRTQGVLGYPQPTTYGESPTFNSSFTKNYKILKHKTYDLAANATERIKIYTALNQTINRAVVQRAADTGSFGVAGLTIQMMAIVRGTPVLVTDSVGGHVRTTTSVCKVGWTLMSRYSLSSLGASRINYNRADQGFVIEVPSTGVRFVQLGELLAGINEGQAG